MPKASILGRTGSGELAQVFRPGTHATASVTSTSTSFTVPAGATIMRLYPAEVCHINFNATATTSHMPLAADVPEYFSVEPGDVVHAIRNASDGTLYITYGSAG
jgi:hypothetical protein